MSLAAAASVSFLVLFSRVKTGTKVFTVIGIIVFLVFLYSNQYFDFILSRFAADSGTGANRTTIWATKLAAFSSDGGILDWIFGIGQREGVKLGFGSGMSTHNDYLSVLLYYGVIGLFFLVCTIAYPLMICSKKVRPKIAAYLIYLLVCSMTIEPLARGNIAYIGFLFYITQLARQSRSVQTGYAQ